MKKRIILLAVATTVGVIAYRKRDQIKQWAEPRVEQLLDALESAVQEQERDMARHSTS